MAGKIGLQSTWKICVTCDDEFLGARAEECLSCRKKRYVKSNQYETVEYGKKKND